MKRTFLPCLFALLAALTGVTAFAASTEQNIPELKTVFSSEIMDPYSVRELFFSEDGTTFLLGSKHNGAVLFRASDFSMLEKHHVCGNQPRCKDEARGHGLGYIDANTWYIATEAWHYRENDPHGEPDGKIVIRVRTIQPSQEVASYSFPSDSCRGGPVNGRNVFANKDHIACSELMINWHTGEKYKVKSTVPVHDIILTKDSRVITYGTTSHLFYFEDYYIINNPLTGESVWVDSFGDPTDRYRVVRSWWGCTLVSVPDGKEIGSCGTSPLFGTDNFHTAFSPSQKLLAVVIADKARVFQTEPFKQLSEFPIFKKVGAIVVSENAWLAADDGKGLLRVWNENGKAVGQYAFGEKKYLRDGLATPPFAFQPGGNKLAVVQVSGVRVFELPVPGAER
ncbi:MAG: hypothetical protein LBP58_10795 [Azoarcus sp.]|jgi:hypothetical protein|nr:hypothetical protein [Azoarcus sp.]